MTNDVVTYTSNMGFVVNLNQPTVTNGLICDVIDLRPFEFSIDKGATVAGDKDFTLTVIARSKLWANTAINRIMADAHDNKYGVLKVNNWYLRCRCLGVDSIDTESYTGDGLFKFVLKFQAPNMLWANKTYYKYNGSTNKFYARNSAGTGWSTSGTSIITISENDGGQYAVSMTCKSPFDTGDIGTINGNFSFDAVDIDLAGNEFASEQYKINFTEALSIDDDFLFKSIKYISGALSGYSAIDSVPDDSDWFAVHPYAAQFKVRNLQGTVSGNLFFTIHRLRGMPEWD